MSTALRLTLQDYDDMVAAGLFDGKCRRRVEFIRGEIREMSPIGPEHAQAVSWLTRWSIENVPREKGEVRIQSSLRIPLLESVPEPDVAWYRPGSYGKRHPQAEDLLLLIEVADSSFTYHRAEKAELYAEAGIAEYWIVDVCQACIEIHRDPRDGHYASLRTVTDDEIAPLCRPQTMLRAGALFACGTGDQKIRLPGECG